MNKQNLLVSFSGGETSAYMAQWLWNNKRDVFNMKFVFANTGQENEETLLFVQNCSDWFGFPVVWVESVFHKEVGKGTTHRIVDFQSADREGKRFEEHIATYGIPNSANPQCTKELKQHPIKSYARSIGWKGYHTAIGIRIDEIDRVNAKRKKLKLYYPLCEDHPTTKAKINSFWAGMPFRLNLKGYEGNCKWCWKKSYKKLLKIASEHPEHFDFPAEMEKKYGNYFPQHRLKKWLADGKEVPKDITFFRGGKSAVDILNESKASKQTPIVPDDSKFYQEQGLLFDISESCDIYSSCGDY